MSAFPRRGLIPFAADVDDGLSAEEKHIAAHHLYDEIGVGLFNTIALLPEYGLARAEERVLRRHSTELARLLDPICAAAELGGENNRGPSYIARSLYEQGRLPDVLPRALEIAGRTLRPISPASDWLNTAAHVVSCRHENKPLLLMLLGSSAGRLDPRELHIFLENLRGMLRPGDYFLFAADLLKDIDKMMAAYDDGAGVVSAFNRNLLGRINRELGGRFDLRRFGHAVRWDAFRRRIELHLIAQDNQHVYIGALGRRFPFKSGESIRTECSYKFSELDLETLAGAAGFRSVKTWIDIEWASAEVLWAV